MSLETENNGPSLEVLECRVRENPDCALSRTKLATALLKLGKTKRAEAELRKAIEIDAGYIPALVNLGGILLARWDFRGCVDLNRQAASHKPDAIEAHFNQGLAHLYLEEKEEMVACFERVVALDDSHAAGHYYLAVGLLSLNREEEARVALSKAVQLGYKPQPDILKALNNKDGKNSAHKTKGNPDIQKNP
ncbi:MAG: tetratricopeptide repeat protein [Myxococcota bacterium]|nr:tetratricopeptide repeat protein [Myxococcota bacterium]